MGSKQTEVYKGRRGESDGKKSGTTAGDDGGKIQQKQQSGTIRGLGKNLRQFIPRNLNEPQ